MVWRRGPMLQPCLTSALLCSSVLEGRIKTTALKLSFPFPCLLPNKFKAPDCQLWVVQPKQMTCKLLCSVLRPLRKVETLQTAQFVGLLGKEMGLCCSYPPRGLQGVSALQTLVVSLQTLIICLAGRASSAPSQFWCELKSTRLTVGAAGLT